MAHELTQRANGTYEFAYTGDSPWHSLGQHLAAEATKDDILKAAGLEWVVQREPLYLGSVPTSKGIMLGDAVEGFVANVRSDTREILGVVSKDYRLIQNGDALAFVDSLAQSSGAKYHTAGSVRRGRQVFATAKLPQSLVVLKDDIVDQYLLLVNAHDGSLGFHLRWTTVRVVCNNTLTAAMGAHANYQYTVRHIGDLDAQLSQARRALGVADRYFEVAGSTFKALAARQINTADLNLFVESFLPLMPGLVVTEEQGVERDSILKSRQKVLALVETGIGTDITGVRGTAWGAYNAATEWIDRVRTAKKDGSMRAGAAEAAVLGVGQDLRNQAMRAALNLLRN